MDWVPALSVMVTVPGTEPFAVGVNETWMVHDAPGAMLSLQLFVWLNGGRAAIFETCRGPVPVLFSVTFFVFVVYTTCTEKDRAVGVAEAAGAVPVPLSCSTCAGPMFPESSLTLRVP